MKLRRVTRVWVYLLLALGLVAVLVLVSRRKPLPEVEVYTVQRGEVDAAITTNGKVEPVMPYEMHSLVESVVTQVYAIEGQHVRKGQPILDLDDSAVRAQLAEVRAQLLTNEDSLRSARAGGKATQLAELDSDTKKNDVNRTRQQQDVTALEKLVTQQAATQQELANARASLAATEADLQRLQASRAEIAREANVDTSRLELADQQSKETIRFYEERLRSTRVIAPVDGTLYALPVKLNEPVHPGEELAAVADLRKIRVRAYVDEPEMGGLQPNQVALITWDAVPNQTWRGITGPVPREVVTHGTRSVGEVLCTVDNQDQRLIPNINVNVRIELSVRKGVLVVPRGAVVFSGSHRYVFVLANSQFGVKPTIRQQEVHLGSANSTMFEITSGLKEGDTIAIPNNVDLKDGMRVRTLEPE